MPDVETIGFKSGEPLTNDNGQSETKETVEEKTEETKAEETQVESNEETQVETNETSAPVKEAEESSEEDVSSLPQWAQDRIKKVDEEKENYKKGMLKYKDLSLKKKEDKKEEKKEEDDEEYPEWDDKSAKFQKQTLSEAEKIAEKKAVAIMENANEKSAIAQFIQENPELAEETKWNELISNYAPTSGKATPADVLKDLNRALIVTRYENGELDNIAQEAEQRGEQKGKAEAHVADAASVSDTTSKTVKGKETLSDSALQLAKAMRVNPEDLAGEDDSLTAVHNF